MEDKDDNFEKKDDKVEKLATGAGCALAGLMGIAGLVIDIGIKIIFWAVIISLIGKLFGIDVIGIVSKLFK